MSSIRFNAVEEASRRAPTTIQSPGKRASDYYGILVFNRKQMSKYLSKETMKIVTDAIDEGKILPRGIAEHVAAGMKLWAMEMGVTHYSH